jgi:hypothetical protein
LLEAEADILIGRRHATATSGESVAFATGCSGYAFGMLLTRRATINGRRVFFSQGNHGSNAWACIPRNTGGFRDVAVAGLWENFMTPQAAMQLVAHARH